MSTVVKPRVIVESPYAGDTVTLTEANVEYARRCVRDSVLRGEAPLASHLLFTQPGILDDTVAKERELGIAAGHAWLEVADVLAVYIDRGLSSGMLKAQEGAKAVDLRVEARTLLK